MKYYNRKHLLMLGAVEKLTGIATGLGVQFMQQETGLLVEKWYFESLIEISCLFLN